MFHGDGFERADKDSETSLNKTLVLSLTPELPTLHSAQETEPAPTQLPHSKWSPSPPPNDAAPGPTLGAPKGVLSLRDSRSGRLALASVAASAQREFWTFFLSWISPLANALGSVFAAIKELGVLGNMLLWLQCLQLLFVYYSMAMPKLYPGRREYLALIFGSWIMLNHCIVSAQNAAALQRLIWSPLPSQWPVSDEAPSAAGVHAADAVARGTLAMVAAWQLNMAINPFPLDEATLAESVWKTTAEVVMDAAAFQADLQLNEETHAVLRGGDVILMDSNRIRGDGGDPPRPHSTFGRQQLAATALASSTYRHVFVFPSHNPAYS